MDLDLLILLALCVVIGILIGVLLTRRRDAAALLNRRPQPPSAPKSRPAKRATRVQPSRPPRTTTRRPAKSTARKRK